MPRIFVEPEAVREGKVRVSGPDARHLAQVLRCRVGERLTVVAGVTEHLVEIMAVRPDAVDARVLTSRPATGEPHLQVTVLQALVRAEDFEMVVECGAELGVARFVPVLTARSVPRWSARSAAGKLTRWQAIAKSAAELSGRGRIPSIAEPTSLQAALTTAPTPVFFLDTGDAPPLAGMDVRGDTATLCVGPEGGFSDEERALASRSGAQPVSLGLRVLRSRIAALIATTLLFQQSGDLGQHNKG